MTFGMPHPAHPHPFDRPQGQASRPPPPASPFGPGPNFGTFEGAIPFEGRFDPQRESFDRQRETFEAQRRGTFDPPQVTENFDRPPQESAPSPGALLALGIAGDSPLSPVSSASAASDGGTNPLFEALALSRAQVNGIKTETETTAMGMGESGMPGMEESSGLVRRQRRLSRSSVAGVDGSAQGMPGQGAVDHSGSGSGSTRGSWDENVNASGSGSATGTGPTARGTPSPSASVTTGPGQATGRRSASTRRRAATGSSAGTQTNTRTRTTSGPGTAAGLGRVVTGPGRLAQHQETHPADRSPVGSPSWNSATTRQAPGTSGLYLDMGALHQGHPSPSHPSGLHSAVSLASVGTPPLHHPLSASSLVSSPLVASAHSAHSASVQGAGPLSAGDYLCVGFELKMHCD